MNRMRGIFMHHKCLGPASLGGWPISISGLASPLLGLQLLGMHVQLRSPAKVRDDLGELLRHWRTDRRIAVRQRQDHRNLDETRCLENSPIAVDHVHTAPYCGTASLEEQVQLFSCRAHRFMRRHGDDVVACFDAIPVLHFGTVVDKAVFGVALIRHVFWKTHNQVFTGSNWLDDCRALWKVWHVLVQKESRLSACELYQFHQLGDIWDGESSHQSGGHGEFNADCARELSGAFERLRGVSRAVQRNGQPMSEAAFELFEVCCFFQGVFSLCEKEIGMSSLRI